MQQRALITLGELKQRVTQLEKDVADIKGCGKRVGLLALLGLVGLAANVGPEGVGIVLDALKRVLL